LPKARATTTTLEYLPEFGRTVRIAEFDRPMLSDDEETAQTVQYMDELAAADAENPTVIAAAHEALELAGLDTASGDFEKACAVYWWLKQTIRYVPTPGTSPLVDQTLISPSAVLAMPEPIGDCPQFSMLACAMFRVLCMNSLYVTIAAEEFAPDLWSHIYNTVEVGPGTWMPFDSSNGPEPGAEYARPFKRRVWPRIAPNNCSKGKTAMMRSTRHRAGASMRNRSLRGALGDVNCDSDGNCYDDSTGEFTAGVTGGAAPDCAFGGVWPNCISPSGAPAPPSLTPAGTVNAIPSGTSLAAPLATLISSAAQVAAPLVKAATQQAPYYITNPATGQAALYNPNTGTFAAGTAALSSLSPTTLLIGAVLIGALVFAGKK
jgi:hypothetical protein